MPGGDELPPGLMAAIGGAAPNGMIIDATVTGFTEEGWGIVNVHNILMKQEGVRPPAIIKGYQATPTMVAKLSLIAPAPQQRALFLLGPDPEMLLVSIRHEKKRRGGGGTRDTATLVGGTRGHCYIS